jgi:hypothetical protein
MKNTDVVRPSEIAGRLELASFHVARRAHGYSDRKARTRSLLPVVWKRTHANLAAT